MKPLIVVGTGGMGREMLLWAGEAVEPFDVVGFLDDNAALHGTEVCGLPVFGPCASWMSYPDAVFIVAVNPPRVRRSIVTAMESLGPVPWATVVHRRAVLSKYVELGEGCVITSDCLLTTQIRLGRHCFINASATIGHDCVFGDFVTVAPGSRVSGEITLEDGVEIGTGAMLRQGLTIGRGAMVGMGSVLTKDVAAGDLVMGSPARPARQLESF